MMSPSSHDTYTKRLKALNQKLSAQGYTPEAIADYQREVGRAFEEAVSESQRLRIACVKINDDVCQTLGKALGYPNFCDDQKNFPGSTLDNGVCVGDHTAETLAVEAVERITELENRGV